MININLIWLPISIIMFIIFLVILLYIIYRIIKQKFTKYIQNQTLTAMHKICNSDYPIKQITNSESKWNPINAFSFYNICLRVSSWSECSTDPNIEGFSILKQIQSEDPANSTIRNIACIYYSSQMNMAIISFAGTVFLSEWTDDFDYTQKQPSFVSDSSIKVQHSQCLFYENMRDNIVSAVSTLDTKVTVMVIGHSLGGALASFCFMDLVVNKPIYQSVLYTYAMPRAGNVSFADFITKTQRSYRVCNTEDIIPYFPLPIMPDDNIYEHFGKLVSFTLNLGDLEENHMTSYSQYLSSIN